MKRKISIVAPALNEEDCVEELAVRLSLVFDDNPSYDFEAIIVDNGSSDKTLELLSGIHERDSRFTILSLARNFQTDGGISAGLSVADGDAAVLMTADLQDPPELINDFIALWESGYENIYMIVTKRTGVNWLRRVNSQLFYWFAKHVASIEIPRNASDFRLVDRKVYETVRDMPERNRFMRGLFAWVGFKSIGIEAERPARFGGTSKAFSMRVFNLGLRGVLSHSYRPLRLITILGLLLSLVSILSIGVLSINWITNGVPFPGFGSLVALELLLFGLLFLIIGIVSEYISLIYEEVKQRPNFIISSQSRKDHPHN